MIKALHDAGISVVMDVVYNHTYSTDSCFQYTVPNYYYRMKTTGKFSDGSGCGNEGATERAMYRQYVIDSLKYWVNEYHVDGFRFDLMGLMDVETMNMAREALDQIDHESQCGVKAGQAVTPTTRLTLAQAQNSILQHRLMRQDSATESLFSMTASVTV